MSGFAVADLNRVFGIPFSERQLRAITSPLEPSVIMAGAGSGKTAVMTARIVWLVANGLVEPEQVLGLTFTNKAAAEFRSRVRRALLQLDLAPEAADSATVTTYHAFAQQLLRDDGIRIGLEPDVQLLSDVRREQLALSVVRNPRIDIRSLKTQSKNIVMQLLELEDALAEEAVVPSRLRDFDERLIVRLQGGGTQQKIGNEMIETAQRRLELLALVEQFRDAKLAASAIDYADMVRLGLHLVVERPDVVGRLRAQYATVLLDEYQDTSVAQRLLMQTVFGGGHAVTAVGDALQAIYEWRGASAQNIIEFPRHFPRVLADHATADAKVFGLPTTQRFGSRIAAIANSLTTDLRSGLAGVEPLESESDDRFGPGDITVALHPDAAAEFAWLAAQLQAAHETTPWEDMAVLIREYRYAPAIYEALTSANIPVQLIGKQGLLTIPDIAELVAYLRVIHDPAANPSWVRLLSGMRYRVGARDLAHLGRRAHVLATMTSDRRADTWQEQLASASQGTDIVDIVALEDAIADPGDAPISADGRLRIAALRNEIRALRRYAGLPVAELIRMVIRETGLEIEVAASDRAHDRGRRAAIEQFLELASGFAALDQSQSLSAFLQWLNDGEHLNRAAQLQPPMRRDAVSIMTVHASKGLQFDVVALPAMIDGSFPSLRTDGTWPKSATALPFEVLNGEVAPDLLEFPVDDVPRAKDYDAFQDLCRPRNLAEEQRLAYVAVTRAQRRLIASAAHAYANKPQATPSRFLEIIRAGCDAGLGSVAVWAAAPSADVEAQAVNPLPFPQSLEPGYAQRLRDVIAEIRTPSTASFTVDDDEARTVDSWDAAIEHHRAERLLQRSTTHEVPLPVALTTTQVQLLALDPDAFLLNLVRPMPKEPALAAKRGSAFHLWVERLFDQQQLPLDDDEPRDDDTIELEHLQQRFLASEWAKRRPFAQELPFTIGIGRHSIRGRIDAVYRDGDEFVVVDWKTNREQTANPLQLAVYRAAVASSFGVPLAAVRACFFYVVTGETVWLEHEVDIDAVLSGVLQ